MLVRLTPEPMASVDVAYHQAGNLEGEPLILASSLATTRRIWEPLVGGLGERFNLVIYDHRGHGESPVPSGPYSMEDLAGDVLALADRLSIERFSFAGISIGGMVGMWLGVHAPHRVNGLGLIATFADVVSPEMWLERARLVRSQGLEGIAQASLDRWLTSPFRQRHPETVQELQAAAKNTPIEGYAGCCEAIAELDVADGLDRIECPVILVGGDQDISATPELMGSVAGRIPHAHLEMLDAAHLVVVEQPTAVARLLVEHLG